MTLYDAFLKARDDAKTDGYTHLTECADYGDFWGFDFCPPAKEDINGDTIVTVNKKNGAIRYFVPFADLDLYDKRKPIPIEQFADKAAVA